MVINFISIKKKKAELASVIIPPAGAWRSTWSLPSLWPSSQAVQKRVDAGSRSSQGNGVSICLSTRPQAGGVKGEVGLFWSLGPWICIDHFYIKIFPGWAQWALKPAQGQPGCAWQGGWGEGLQEVLQHQPNPPVPFLEECYHCCFLERTKVGGGVCQSLSDPEGCLCPTFPLWGCRPEPQLRDARQGWGVGEMTVTIHRALSLSPAFCEPCISWDSRKRTGGFV